jgi:peroxiredoxin
MKMKKTFILLIISGLITFLSPIPSVAAAGNPLSAAGFFHFKEKKPAPDFILKDVENNWVNLKEFQGKIVLLLFWTTWCPSCRKEVTSLSKLYNEFKDRDFVVFGINVKENRQIVKKYIKKKKMTFPILLDLDGKVEKHYGVRAHPTHFFINRQGEMIASALGERNWMNSRNRHIIKFLLDQD